MHAYGTKIAQGFFQNHSKPRRRRPERELELEHSIRRLHSLCCEEPASIMSTTTALSVLFICLVVSGCASFQTPLLRHTRRIPTRIKSGSDGGERSTGISRRRAIEIAPLILATTTHVGWANAAQNTVPNLDFSTSSSGLQYADVKPGTGSTSPQVRHMLLRVNVVSDALTE